MRNGGDAIRRRRRIDLSAVIERLSPEMRTAIINNFVAVMPEIVLRLSEGLFDIPIADVVRRSRYLFVHIPKNAGTTVNMALYGWNVGHRTALWYRRADKALFDAKLKFAIMRDPVDRFISAFYYLKAGGTAIVPASSRATKFMSRYKSTADFIKDVESGVICSLRKIDPVFHEQCEYIVDEMGNIIVNKIFLLSNIQEGYMELPDRKIDMKKIINKTERIPKNETAEDFTKIRKFVQKYYARDYEILNSYRGSAVTSIGVRRRSGQC